MAKLVFKKEVNGFQPNICSHLGFQGNGQALSQHTSLWAATTRLKSLVPLRDATKPQYLGWDLELRQSSAPPILCPHSQIRILFKLGQRYDQTFLCFEDNCCFISYNVNIKHLFGNKDSSDPRPFCRSLDVNGTKWRHSGHA